MTELIIAVGEVTGYCDATTGECVTALPSDGEPAEAAGDESDR